MIITPCAARVSAERDNGDCESHAHVTVAAVPFSDVAFASARLGATLVNAHVVLARLRAARTIKA